MKHLKKFNEGQYIPKTEFPKYEPQFEGVKELCYQAYLFAKHLQSPNNVDETEEGKLQDDRNIYLNDFEMWWGDGPENGGCILPYQYSERPN